MHVYLCFIEITLSEGDPKVGSILTAQYSNYVYKFYNTPDY